MYRARAEPGSDDQQTEAAGLAILQLLKTGDVADARLARIDELLSDLDEATRGAFAYFVAQELDALGKDRRGRKILASSPRAPQP